MEVALAGKGTVAAAGERTPLNRSHLWAATLIAALNGLDLWTTDLALARGGVEGNPLARVLLDAQLLGPAKFALVALTAAGAYYGRSTLRLVAAAWFVAGVYALVVVSNLVTVAHLS